MAMQGSHPHSGMSSRGLIDAGKVLAAIGLARGQTVLDAGAGTGHFSVAASALVGPAGTVWAIDVDRPSLDLLSRELFTNGIKNIRPLLANLAGELPVRTSSVDLCIMVNVLHGLAYEGRASVAVAEMARVLRPGGRFAVIEFKKEEMSVGPPVEVRLRSDEVEVLATPSGFRRERIFEAGPYSYAIVFRK